MFIYVCLVAHPTLAEYLVVGNLSYFLFLSSMEYGKSRNQSLRDFSGIL